MELLKGLGQVSINLKNERSIEVMQFTVSLTVKHLTQDSSIRFFFLSEVMFDRIPLSAWPEVPVLPPSVFYPEVQHPVHSDDLPIRRLGNKENIKSGDLGQNRSHYN